MMGGTIKLLHKDIDLSQCNLDEYPWDAVVNGKQYKIFNVRGYVHTIGGIYGENSYWACPRDEEPTTKNLIEWNGCIGGCAWGVNMNPHHYIKNKWDETEILVTNGAMITRNDEDFLYVHGPIEVALFVLLKLKEHPISFGNYDWKEQISGRKIYYRSEPAIISRLITGDGYLEMIIEPDGIERFTLPPEFNNGNINKRSEREIKVDVLDPNVYWFRDNK